MSQIEDAMDGLMTAIRNSEEFIRYQAIRKVHGFPKLESQITEFRKKNYLLQNSQGNCGSVMKRQTAWRMSTGSFGRILMVSRVSLQQKNGHSAKL